MKHDAKPTEKTGAEVTGAPRKYSVPLPKDRSRCEGCPYPRVGFICWNPDGTCMKTDVEDINRRSKGR